MFNIVASEWISWGLGKGAEKAEELIKLGSAKLRENIKPEETPKPVDPRIQKGMVFARKATHSAVRVSSFIGEKFKCTSFKLSFTYYLTPSFFWVH